MPKKRKLPNFDTSYVVKTLPEEPKGPIDIVRIFLLQHAEKCKKLYDETGNPLYVWELVHKWFSEIKCSNGEILPSPIQSGLQLPEWTHDYIHTIAANLVYKSEKENPQSNDVGAMLGFTPPKRASGGNSFFKQYHDSVYRQNILFYLGRLLKREQNLSVEKACEKITEESPDIKVDSLTIKKWYDQSNKTKEKE